MSSGISKRAVDGTAQPGDAPLPESRPAWNRRVSDEEIIAAYRATGSIWRAGKRVGLCGQSVHERLRRLGVSLAHQEWCRAELEEAKRLAFQGEPLSQIAARLGRTYYAVALKLSRVGVRSHHSSWRWKPKHVGPIPREKIRGFARLLNQEGWSVRQLARREGLAITPLVDALQSHEPDAWKRYVEDKSHVRPRACPGCGTRFVPLTGKQRYCAVRCREGHHRDLKYFGGRRLEAEGLLDGICQLCGRKPGKWLSAHHLLGRENDPHNVSLVALCRGCHDLVGRLSARPWVERPDVVAHLLVLVLARRGKIKMPVTVSLGQRTGQGTSLDHGNSQPGRRQPLPGLRSRTRS